MGRFGVQLLCVLQSVFRVVAASPDLPLDLCLGITPAVGQRSFPKTSSFHDAKLGLPAGDEPPPREPGLDNLSLSLAPIPGLYHSQASRCYPTDLNERAQVPSGSPICSSAARPKNSLPTSLPGTRRDCVTQSSRKFVSEANIESEPSTYLYPVPGMDNSKHKRKACCLRAAQGFAAGFRSAVHEEEAEVAHSAAVEPIDVQVGSSELNACWQQGIACSLDSLTHPPLDVYIKRKHLEGSVLLGSSPPEVPPETSHASEARRRIQKAHLDYGHDACHIIAEPNADGLKNIVTTGHAQSIPNNLSSRNEVISNTNSRATLLDIKPPEFDFGFVFNSAQSVVSNEYLERNLALYDKGMDGLIFDCKTSARVDENRSFEGIAAAHLTLSESKNDRARSVIRLKTTSYSHPYVSIAKARRSIRKLIKWVVHDHVALLLTVGLTNTFAEEAHETLVHWMMNEAFNPSYALPVMGEVTCPVSTYNRSAFGPIQTLIIDYITLVPSPYTVHQTASAIIGIWYKNFHSHTWEWYFHHDQGFWYRMDQATSSFLSWSSQVKQARKVHPLGNSGKLGNFQIHGLHKNSYQRSSVKGRLSFQGKRYDLSVAQLLEFNDESSLQAIEQSIIDNMYSLYSDHSPHIKNEVKCFENVLVAMVPAIRKTVKGDYVKSYMIRLLDSQKNLATPARIQKQLATFFGRIKYYHGSLISWGLKSNMNFENGYHLAVMRWLQKEMFEPERSLPIFTTVSEDFKPCNKKVFGPLQRFFIAYFSEAHTQHELDDSFIAVLGYWYKNHQKEFWKKNFREDQKYWSFMMKAIENKEDR